MTWVSSWLATRAAATQEMFDQYVFNMPSSTSRSSAPSLEDVARLAGSDETLVERAKAKKLWDWYTIDTSLDEAVSVAIAQRSSASYSNRLLFLTAITRVAIALAWMVFLVWFCLDAEMSATLFIVGVVLPVLPAILDLIDYVQGIVAAARERGDLANAIQRRIESAASVKIDPQDLLIWQSTMYELRRSTLQAPDWIYQLTRKRNEAAMQSAARLLGQRSKDGV